VNAVPRPLANPRPDAGDRRFLFLVQTDGFIPFLLHLARYLRSRGCDVHFAAFLPRENLWLRKNGIRPVPDDVYALKRQPLREDLLEPGEIDRILGFARRKTGGELPVWRRRLLRVAAVLDEALDARRIDAVLIWNGDDYIGKALGLLARRRGIPTVFAENGYFPNTLQFDRQGVNVNSSITGLAFDEIARALEMSPMRQAGADSSPTGSADVVPLGWTDYLRCFVARKADPGYYRHFPEHRGASWFTGQWLKLRRRLIPMDKATLPDRFAFIPFQVHDDTQILLNSRLFDSMEAFFEFCHSAIRRNFGPDFPIVVKEHPEDLGRRSYARLRARYPDVLWLRKFSIDELLDKAACVFVVNSSVGLQALQRGRPTVVFGESFYTKDEIVFRVTDLASADGVIARARDGVSPQRRARIDTFIRFLNERYFVAGGWRKPTPAGIAGAGNRILGLVE
jgi:capsule polysaccharide modification protein KpsS